MKSKKSKKPIRSRKHFHRFLYLAIILLGAILGVYIITSPMDYDDRTRAQSDPKSIKLKVYNPPLPSATPSPTTRQISNSNLIPNTTRTPTTPAGPITIITPAIGGPVPPAGYYCIDDVDPDMCDDNTSHLVPKGTGGISGSCGTVIENAHKIVEALPQVDKGTRDSLTSTVSTSCGSTGPATGYLSTYFVIDAYNLTGYSELSKTNPSHVSPSGLNNWWQSSAATYVYYPYSSGLVQQFATGQLDLTGCVMFLRLGSGSFHIGIVNKLELYNSNGDGVISILQSGTRMYIDRFPVAGWNIENTSTNQTNTSGVEGFGCHQ